MLYVSRFFDWILTPLHRANPWTGMILLSFLAGATAMLIIRVSTDPERVLARRDRAVSRLLELWLYRDDLVLQARAMGGLLVDNLRYVTTLSLPLMLSLAPMLVLLAQAHDHFHGRPLRPQDTVLVEARFRDPAGATAGDGPHLAIPTGFESNPPFVRSSALGTVAWRLRVAADAQPGQRTLWLISDPDAEPVGKQVVIGDGLHRLSPQRVASLWAHFLYPGEPRLPEDGALAAVSVTYPAPGLRLGPYAPDPVWTLVVLALLWGLLLKRPLRVEV